MNKVLVSVTMPRITNRGNQPTMRFESVKILELGVPVDILRNSLRLLSYLYIERQMSQAEIGRLFRVQRQTVSRWLKRMEIPIRAHGDAVSLALTKHFTNPFEGALNERAYLLGLRAGDIHAQIHGRRIRVSVGTTHPAMTELFQTTFSKYAEVRKYPKYSEVSGFHWCVYCDLDSSFDFLLHKPKEIPPWVLGDEVLFLSFLAGYFDSEGCISFDLRPGNHSVTWILSSCDYDILKAIASRLGGLEFRAYLTLARVAGKTNLNHDYWAIKISERTDVWKLLRMIALRHPEKIAKSDLVSFMESKRWMEGWDKVGPLRDQVRLDVDLFKKEAEDLLGKRLSATCL